MTLNSKYKIKCQMYKKIKNEVNIYLYNVILLRFQSINFKSE